MILFNTQNGKALFLFKYNITPFYFNSILFETMKIWGRRLEHAEGWVFEFQPQTNKWKFGEIRGYVIVADIIKSFTSPVTGL